MKDALIVSALSLIPRNRGAQAMGWFARTRLSRWATALFVKVYGVDMDEARGTLEDYPTLEALFTRELREGVRPVDDTPDVLVSPVDGRVAFVGSTRQGRFEVAPGQELAIDDLLGRQERTEHDVAVLYLSPKDYHRVHSPLEGEAVSWRYVPGTLWPVFPAAVRTVPRLFARNERVCLRLAGENGPLDIVLVGAFGVGRITVGVTELVTNTGGDEASGELKPAVPIQRGAELGIFHLGSTVILISEPGVWNWSISTGEVVRVGRAIARRPRLLEAR